MLCLLALRSRSLFVLALPSSKAPSFPFPLPVHPSPFLAFPIPATSRRPRRSAGIDRALPDRADGAAMMMRRVAASLVPPWLEPLLSAHFFTACPLHRDAPRSECNMFCLDCGPASSSFCLYCRSDSHAGHCVIQIRRSSYHDVVRVAEIQKMLDIGGVQTYVINSAPVLFLNERPQPRGGGRGGGASAASSSSSTPYTCEICSRSLLDPFRFCSLGCKLAGVKRNGDATFVLNPGDEEPSDGGGGIRDSSSTAPEESKSGRSGRSGGGSREGTRHDALGPASPPPAPNSRRRKGIPRRAPFAS